MFWTERYNKGFVKVVAPHEIFDGVLIGLTEQPFINEIKDDITKINAFVDAPLPQHPFGNGTELLQCIFAHTVEQLLTTDMAGFIELFNRVVEPFPHEEVGFGRIAFVLFKDRC